MDLRINERAFVLFKDGSSSLVLGKALYTTSDYARVNLDVGVAPRCIYSKCNLAIEQGIWPKFCGRRTACSRAHYCLARDNEGFEHHGFISPGIDLTDPTYFPKKSTGPVIASN